jgi:DNA-binding NarL/FixJ family response regulator
VVVVPAETEQLAGVARPAGPRLLLIGPQTLLLAVLSGLLTAPPLGAEVHVSSGTDAIDEWLTPPSIDLVLCDRRAMPVPALDLAKRLSELPDAIPMILLGDPEDEGLLLAALTSTVAGVFTKDASLDEFLVGVTTVLAGHRVVGNRIMAALVARAVEGQGGAVRGPISKLSPTELDILTMVGSAQSIATIAQVRGISHKTVRNHLTNICRKLQLRGRSEAMLWAARMGLSGSAVNEA